MGLIDAFWHLLNFVAPAFAVGLISTGMARLLWRKELAGTPWQRMATWAIGADLLVLCAGLALSGHDGKMTTYASLLMVNAGALWWGGFGPGKPVRRS
ncbi:MAG: hypothetical protein AB3X46_12050 [Leptothrix ochracea]|uniref:hypothetical protein n=1 Tax=Leptothrix ochracea TaxID=735331 RepID=UPI0034E1E64E